MEMNGGSGVDRSKQPTMELSPNGCDNKSHCREPTGFFPPLKLAVIQNTFYGATIPHNVTVSFSSYNLPC